MPIQVKLFASLRERAGWSERLVTPKAHPATPLLLWRQLRLDAGGEETKDGPTPADRAPDSDPQGPAAASPAGDTTLPPGIRVAINQTFAAPDMPVADGDELAFLPPISGG